MKWEMEKILYAFKMHDLNVKKTPFSLSCSSTTMRAWNFRMSQESHTTWESFQRFQIIIHMWILKTITPMRLTFISKTPLGILWSYILYSSFGCYIAVQKLYSSFWWTPLFTASGNMILSSEGLCNIWYKGHHCNTAYKLQVLIALLPYSLPTSPIYASHEKKTCSSGRLNIKHVSFCLNENYFQWGLSLVQLMYMETWKFGSHSLYCYYDAHLWIRYF